VATHGKAPWYSWVVTRESDPQLERLRLIRLVVIILLFAAFIAMIAFPAN
jgi:hypothetical protein